MREFKAPDPYSLFHNDLTIFLAGSIEMGKAEDWQSKIATWFADRDDVVLLNPRREDWDSTWVQSIHNEKFHEQVSWELTSLDHADIIIMNLLPETMSPISLLELGLYADSGKMMVCCPDGFWRKGNVDIVCQRYGIPVYNTIEELLEEIA